MLFWAVEEQDGPVAIRYPRGGDRGFSDAAWIPGCNLLNCGAVARHRTGSDITLLTYGVILKNVMDAADILSEEGIESSVIRLLMLAPLPVQQISDMLPHNGTVVVLEEISGRCGICHELAYSLRMLRPDCRVVGVDLGSRYIRHGSLDSLYEYYGLSPAAIAKLVEEELHSEN